MSQSYKGGLSFAGLTGAVCAAVVAVPLFGLTFLNLALGDCAPGANCWTGWGMLPLDAITVTAIGFGIAFLIDAIAKRLAASRERS